VIRFSYRHVRMGACAIYKVYRCVECVKDWHVGDFPTLGEAFACARIAATDAGSRFIHFRIQGPLPEQWRDERGEGARSAWFVLDDDPMPPGSLRVSDVLATLHDGSAIGGAHATSAANAGRASGRGQAPDQRRFYRVDRVAHGSRQILRDRFETEKEAQAFLARWQKEERDPSAYFIIVPPTTRSSDARRASQRSDARLAPQRGEFDLRDDTKEPKRERRRRDWEVSDRHGDLSLASRFEEELGLGIPAQTNKGRRSRKGDYIP
jgi:hypothetical protein